ncbi:hypothetical protein N7533_011344 [Penicillium manginii]|uniref:uncharacterized protein n=1 Tax=Penicillium manginii TaxID=203109 RepID=UPI00254835AF|nr:uncharacterized protein N7533_011344 [Penicillium manginii]KAJ5741935.1 hypothetical protein N7533_011344 [Penicillium manginii]
MSTASPHRDTVRPRGRPCKSSTGTDNSVRTSLPLFFVRHLPDLQERRRQIRDAQRAYRSRQQSLLESLKERNAHLEDVVGQLSQIMHSFHQTKASPHLPLSNLPKAVDLLEDEITLQLKRAEAPSLRENSQQNSQHYANLPMFQEKMQHLLVQPSLDLAKTVYPPTPVVKQSDSPFWTSFLQTSHLLIPGVPPTLYNASCDTSTGPLDLHGPPIPYATTPFTQKLFRACAESGHRYLMNDTVTDHEMWREFGLMLQKVPRVEVTLYFKRVLAATPCNPIEDFRFPFISLGGAGTHFPRTRQISIGASGLHNLLPFQTTNGIKELPSDEEWFDVHDVEGFLSSRGILLKSNRSLPTNSELSGTRFISHGSSQSFLEQTMEGDCLSFDEDLSITPIMSVDETSIIGGRYKASSI